MIANQRDFVVAVEVTGTLERSTLVEEDLAKALRENFTVPVIQTLLDIRSFGGLSVDHSKNQFDDSLIRNFFHQFFSRVKSATPVVLKPGEVEQRIIHHDLSNDAPCREDVHRRLQLGSLHRALLRSPPFGRRVAPDIIVEVPEVQIVISQVVILNVNGFVGQNIRQKQPVVARHEYIVRLDVSVDDLRRVYLLHRAQELENQPFLLHHSQQVRQPFDPLREVVADKLPNQVRFPLCFLNTVRLVVLKNIGVLLFHV